MGDQATANINFDAISELRNKPGYGRNGVASRNGAGLEIKRKKEKAIQPKSPHKDPYILALLLALAQSQRKLGPEAKQWKVLVVGIPGIGARHLFCYEAWVPVQLLKKLDDPSIALAYSKIAISITKIDIRKSRDGARDLWAVLHENRMLSGQCLHK